MRKRKVNDNGMTLVELLVSVAILAIIVLPLLTAFVQASKTNAKAKDKLRASELAYNVMEGLENVSIENIAYQFNYSSEGFNLFSLNDASGVCEVRKISEADSSSGFVEAIKMEDIRAEVANKSDLITSSIIKKSATEYDFAGQDNHKYYFYVNSVKIDKKKYSALITIDAKTDNAGTINSTYNNVGISRMQSIDNSCDALSANTDTSRDVEKDIANAFNLSSIDEKNISRNIIVDVSYNPDNGRCQVKVSYRYKFFNGGRYVTFPETGSVYENDYTNVIYDNSSHTEDSLKNIYILYYPWYSSTGYYNSCTDKITINNPNNVECITHIIKQNIVDSNQLMKYENDYKMAVELNEVANNSARSYMKIESNLGYNMKTNEVVANQVTYVFNNNSVQEDVKKIISIRKLNEQDASDRLFDITIDIYEAGTNLADIGSKKKIVSITGGMKD